MTANTDGIFELWIDGIGFHAEGSYLAMTQLMGIHSTAGRLCWLERAKDEQEEGL